MTRRQHLHAADAGNDLPVERKAAGGDAATIRSVLS